jgi:signal transduction histidine kinase
VRACAVQTCSLEAFRLGSLRDSPRAQCVNRKKDTSLAGFSVDTKLFRELGELLVGRESTALVELIKNAYDADATKVTILGRGIADSRTGSIIVSDNGVGMSEAEFSQGFLRIAGRSKTTTDRRSTWFKRRYTGEKGLGRLAAHKLAHGLQVRSRRWNGIDRDPLEAFPSDHEIRAKIDWDAIEALETLSQIEGSGAVELRATGRTKGAAGTQLTLAPLRRQWGDRERERFFEEVATLTPPEMLLAPLQSVIMSPLLHDTLVVRDERRAGEFNLHYRGDLALAEGDLPASPASASWIIEIDCDKRARRLRIAVAPTRKTLGDYSNAESFIMDRAFDEIEPDVGFQARILQISNGQWPKRYQGVRIYYEGFRVLPYGDPRDDWLELDRDYRSRGHNELGRLRDRSWNLPRATENEGLAIQGNTAVFGAVLLTRSGADELKMLINREGFLPSKQFTFIEETVRLAIDLQVRLRYAATSEVKQARQVSAGRQQHAARRAASGQSPSAYLLRQLHETAHKSLTNARTAIAAGQSKEARAQLAQLEKTLGSATDLSDEVISEATMFRVLASIGLEHAAFVHEVRSLSLAAQTLADTLERLSVGEANRDTAKRLRAVATDAREIRERLRRNAVYLADVTGIEGRRRRSRQKLRERIDRVLGFFDRSIEKRRIKLQVNVADDVQTPPLFPAEMTAILSNVLSNAIKFAGDAGHVGISASTLPGSLRIRVENSGAAVNLASSERWFEPFRSTTHNVDESLGQGMGLGLTITRSLLDEYGGTIRFVPPSRGFATAIEVELPQR